MLPSMSVSALNRADSNCLPLSVVIVDGAPKRATQCVTNEMATVSAEMSGIGMASGHRVNRSMTVKRYDCPLEGGRGPTMSMWTWSNLASGVANVPHGDLVWR